MSELSPLQRHLQTALDGLEDVKSMIALLDEEIASVTQRAEIAEATAAGLRAAVRSAVALLLYLDQCGGLGLDAHRAIDETLTPLGAALADDAGAALLAERDAARAVIAAIRKWNRICPFCGFGKRLDGSPFHGKGCPRAAYDAGEARGWRPETSGKAG